MASPIRCVVALTLSLGLASGIEAQGRHRGGYTGFFAAGMSRIASNRLDDRLAANGHPTFGSSAAGFNVGAYKLLRGGVMLGGEWHFLPVGNETHQGREVGLGAGYATLGVAYAFEPSPRTRVYPRLGLGIGGMGLWSEDATQSGPVGFDQWQANPDADPKFTTLSQGSMAIDLGAGAELLLRKRGGGPIVGLRFGYVATPLDQGWTRDGQDVNDAPNATVAGPYVRILLGWRRE